MTQAVRRGGAGGTGRFGGGRLARGGNTRYRRFARPEERRRDDRYRERPGQRCRRTSRRRCRPFEGVAGRGICRSARPAPAPGARTHRGGGAALPRPEIVQPGATSAGAPLSTLTGESDGAGSIGRFEGAKRAIFACCSAAVASGRWCYGARPGVVGRSAPTAPGGRTMTRPDAERGCLTFLLPDALDAMAEDDVDDPQWWPAAGLADDEGDGGPAPPVAPPAPAARGRARSRARSRAR